HNGSFYNDLREMGRAEAMSLEVWSWRDDPAERPPARLSLQWTSPHPPLGGCDVYGAVRKFWFPEAQGFITGPDKRADIRRASAVKLTASTVRATRHAPLL